MTGATTRPGQASPRQQVQPPRRIQEWLAAWSSNDPHYLASFYADDAFYLDPATPDGIEGQPALTAYFEKLLGDFPDWVWTLTESFALEGGLFARILVRVPIGPITVRIVGGALLQFDDDGKVRRNEMYFDRSHLLAAIAEHNDRLSLS